MSLLRALRHRAFALLWAGQTISRIGDFLYEVALAWWVLEKTGSAEAMATVLVFAFAPMLVFLLIGGVAVDRLPRVPLMLASDVVRGVVVAAVAALAWQNRLTIEYMYAASLIFGLVDAFFQPAFTATVPDLVPSEDLPSANSLSSMGIQAGRIAGPPLGGALVALSGTPLAFALNAASFFVSAACLVPLIGLRPVPAPAPAGADGAQRSSPLSDMRQGLATVVRTPWLWVAIVSFALVNVTLGGPYSVTMPFLVSDHLHGDAQLLGLLYAIFPAGYILGVVLLGYQARIRRHGLLMYGGLVLAGLGLGVFGLPVPLLVIGVAAFVNGAALEVGNLAWTNLLQERIPREQLGRVSSIDMLGSYVLVPVGYALAGWATGVLGPAQVFVLGGGVTAVLGALALLLPRIREVR